jgi:predicted ATPase/class 3 adenylate cyclase
MPELPTGTVTFLFTDLEGSTLLWEEHPAAMKSALARHDSILQESVDAHGGVVFSRMGDGLAAAFESAADAVEAVLDSQRRLGSEPWGETGPLRVRTGLHTGPARAEDGDYHGATVNRAARVAGAAHPGQILVSAATAALLQGWTLRDLGEHRLRGLPAMRLLQVTAPGLVDDFPLLATSSPGVALPSPPTTFVGRAGEIEVVGSLLSERRLVTLTGLGGCGKTRLAIETAARLAGRFTDGARFADLAAVTDDSRVVDAVVHAVGLADDPTGAEPLARLASYLADRALICVLDNCEHLLDACAELCGAIVARPGSSRLLATSREPLGVVGEQLYLVDPLDASTDALRLFADRATEVRAEFAVDDANRDVITQICLRLDGSPLAIELAAARVAHLSPAQILDRIDDRFGLLTGGRGRPQRHQTLAATLDWSHDLLEGRDQMVLRRLAVFPASFSLEAAEAVAGVGDIVEPLGSLVAKSLVQVVDDADRLRYRLLETVRLYAETKLVTAGEAEPCRVRHCDWVLDWLGSVPLEERWLGDGDLLTEEQSNIRAALEWCASEGQTDSLARIAVSVDWARGDTWRDGIHWCETAAATADALPPDLQVQLALMLFQLTRITVGGPADWVERNAWSQRAIDASREQPSALHALALTARGLGAAVLAVAELKGDSLAPRATEWAEAGAAMSEQFSAPWQKYCRLLAGETYTILSLTLPGGADRAEEHFAAGVAAAPPAPPYLGLHARLCCYLALHKAVTGDADGALTVARDAQVDGALELLGREDPLALALVVALASADDVGGARRELRAYDEAARRADWGLALESVVLYGGILAALGEDWERASRLLSAGERSVFRSPATAQLYFVFRDRVRAALGPDLCRQLRAEGRAMTLADAREAALR